MRRGIWYDEEERGALFFCFVRAGFDAVCRFKYSQECACTRPKPDGGGCSFRAAFDVFFSFLQVTSEAPTTGFSSLNQHTGGVGPHSSVRGSPMYVILESLTTFLDGLFCPQVVCGTISRLVCWALTLYNLFVEEGRELKAAKSLRK